MLQAEALGRIEEAMSALRRATEASQLEAAALRSHLERLSVSEESARLEVWGSGGEGWGGVGGRGGSVGGVGYIHD